MQLPVRVPALLSDSLNVQLNAYALAASAAGVGLLVLAAPGEAKIIYTPAHEKIGPKSKFNLDLSHDGNTDFTLTNGTYIGSFGTSLWFLSVGPARDGNEVWGHTFRSGRYGAASALFPKVRIKSAQHFAPGEKGMATLPLGSANTCSGPWANVRNRYLGFKFAIDEKTHFGWARLNVSCPYGSGEIVGTLTGYAYETVPGRSIVTGQERGPDELVTGNPPAELGRLALGAQGLPTQAAQGAVGSQVTQETLKVGRE